MKNYSAPEKVLIFLDSFLGFEYKFKRQLCDYAEKVESFEQFIEDIKEFVCSTVGEKEYNTIKSSLTQQYIETLLLNLDKKGIKVTTYLSNDYPENLFQVEWPPLVLYYKGDIEVCNGELFGIVGSRKSLTVSLSVAERYAKELSNANFTLVTGIAEGVDAKVLTTALSNGGKVVSVIAGGLDNIYPKKHTELIERVAENGLVLSEYPPEVSPKPFHFPVRNRIIAGLSKGVLIVSGGKTSGTLYTAEYANDLSKDLFAIPYSVDVPSGAGCNDLIKKGAYLTDTPKDILDFYGVTVEKQKVSLTDSEREIISALKDGSLHIEKISALLKKQVFEITPLLSVLEIKGIIAKSGNVYGLTRNDLED